MDLFSQMMTRVCVPLALVCAFGFFVDRKFKLDMNTLVSLNFRLFVPAFIFVRLSSAKLSESREGWSFLWFTLAMLAALFVTGALMARALRLSQARTKSLQLAGMFYNCGNWGVPLIHLAFGESSLSIQVFVLSTMNVCTFTFGLFLAHSQTGGGVGRSLAAASRQPSIYAIIAALLVRWTGWEPWNSAAWLWGAAEPLADALPGIALVTLGAQLSKTRPQRPDAALSAALLTRLVAGPLIAWGFCHWFGFDHLSSAVLIAGAAAPTAVNTALLAHEFKGDAAYASAAVFYSTVFSLFTSAMILATMRSAGWF